MPKFAENLRALAPDLAWGCALTLSLALGTFVFEAAFDHAGWLLEADFDDPRFRITVALWVLAGFLLAAGDLWGRRGERDILDLAPPASVPEAEMAELAAKSRRIPVRWLALAASFSIPAGLLVVTVGDGSSTPILLSDTPLSHDEVRGLLVNVVVFGVMAAVGVRTLVGVRDLSRLATDRLRVDLLDLSSLRPFAQHGLRNAFLWLGGSSIAGLVFVDQSFAIGTALVLLITVVLGSAALLFPLRGVHRLIREAKRAELMRVREAIGIARDETLESPAGGGRLADLLAYESRIAAVREWPVDVPQLSRFGLLLVVAIGSWVGGAVVERLLGAWLD